MRHQTVRLSRGRHRTPRDGACAMELASLLAGERFSDHPRCVSPVVAAFVRVYNDLVDDRRRADLYAYVSAAVGSRGTRRDETVRARRLLDWLSNEFGERGRVECAAMAVGIVTRHGRRIIAEQAARYAASSRSRHGTALALLDTLVGGAPVEALADPATAREGDLAASEEPVPTR